VNTVAASFNTIIGQMTEMSQRKNPRARLPKEICTQSWHV